MPGGGYLFLGLLVTAAAEQKMHVTESILAFSSTPPFHSFVPPSESC